jgi:hypothetical protein
MRLIPRRKRTWVLVLLGVAILGAWAVWWAATAKSDFERTFDQIEVGMSTEEVSAVMSSGQAARNLNANWNRMRHKGPLGQIIWDDAGEKIVLDFEDGQLASKGFTPLHARGRLRWLWTHCFKSAPPF